MNRSEFQHLAEVRVREAEALLAAGLWDGAYYLAGYAVECGLKACIAKQTKAEDFPPDKDTIGKIYSHNLGNLRTAAKLDAMFGADEKRDPNLGANWRTVRDGWSEQTRYARTTEQAARDLLVAITDPASGVLTWIKRYW